MGFYKQIRMSTSTTMKMMMMRKIGDDEDNDIVIDNVT